MDRITLDILKDIGNIQYNQDGSIELFGEYYPSIVASEGKIKGKWYWEVQILHKDENTNGGIGLGNENMSTSGQVWLGRTSNEIMYRVHRNDVWYNRNTYEPNTHSKEVKSGDILGFYLDLDNNRVTTALNGIISPKSFDIPFEYQYIRPMFGKVAKSTSLKLHIKPNLGVEPFQFFSPQLQQEGFLPYDIDNAHHENMNYDANQYMFEKNGEMYQLFKDKIEKTTLKKDSITQEEFEQYGTKNINLVIKHLSDDYTIVCMSDRYRNRQQNVCIKGQKDMPLLCDNIAKILVYADKVHESQRVHIKGRKDLRELGCKTQKIFVGIDTVRDDVPLANIKGYNSPQLVIPTGDIRLNRVNYVHDLKITAKDKQERVRIVYSTDSGNTWYTKVFDEVDEKSTNSITTLEVDINDLNGVQEYGMTINEFNRIKEDWTPEIVQHGKIRFAYYLDIDNTNEVSNIDKLGIKITMYGRWVVVNNGERYSYGYTNDMIHLDLLEDGTYKINYHN